MLIRHSFLVYDFDGDGKAEITCQTSLGSKDANNEYVSKSADPADNSKIYNLTDEKMKRQIIAERIMVEL